MTKEEVIKKYDLHFEEMTKANPEEYISVKLLRAMDEYAKEVAIDFANWLEDNNKMAGDYTGEAGIIGDLAAHFNEYQQEKSSLK